MFDLLLLLMLAVLFLGAVCYVRACVELTRPMSNGNGGHQ